MKPANLSASTILLLIIAAGLLLYNAPIARAQTTIVGVFSQDYFTGDVVDPTLTPGSFFDLEVTITDAPFIVDSTNGGVNAMDITLNYNPAILKATDANYRGTFCPSSENCLWAPLSVLELSRRVDIPPGTTRVAVAGQGDTTNSIQGSGILFKIRFQVLGTGSTPITILDISDLITGLQGGVAVPLPHQIVNGSFDNTPPYTVLALPDSASVNASRSTSTTVLVTLNPGNSAENVTLALNGLPAGATALFNPLFGFPDFSSQLSITTFTTTPAGNYTIRINGFCATCAGGSGFSVETDFLLTVNVPDAAVTAATSSTTQAFIGETVSVSTSIKNEGTIRQSYTVNLLANGNIVASGSSSTLGGGTSETLTLSWDTTGVSAGVYALSVQIPVLTDEFDTADNAMQTGSLTLSRVNTLPTASFTISLTSPSTNDELTFDASQSSDPDGTISTYSWNFGDGTPTAAGKTVTHKFQSAGTYSVTLTITDNDGASQTKLQTVTVSEPAPTFISTLTSPLGLAAIAIAILVILALVYFARKRGKKPSEMPKKPNK